MKLLAILSLLLCTTAYAIDNPKVSISTNSDLVLHQENSKNIQEISAKTDVVSDGIDKYQKCIDKGLIYLGTGAANVDADNCYDVTNTTNPDTNFRVTFAGHLKLGQLSETQATFYTSSPAYKSYLNGRFGADKQCNTEYAGSRALVFEDLRYLMPVLSDDANVNTSPIWVYDSVLSIYNHSTNQYTSKYLDTPTTNINDCNGWGTISTSDRGTILIKRSINFNTYLDVSNQTCTTSAYIACVYN